MKTYITARLPQLVSVFLASTILLFFHWKNQLPPDVGDGLSHFFIANAVWSDPLMLLDHWGKPLFVLFAAPFAFFGFFSYVCFNLIVFIATGFIGQSVLNRLGTKWPIQGLFPFVLISVFDYTNNILGGLTGPFFGCLLLLACLFFLKKNYLIFAVFISFLPFARSEGQLIVCLSSVLLLVERKWRFIPFLATGFLIYAFIGYAVLGDFWWYFTQNPYRGAANIYGHGTWWHYVENRHTHLGTMGELLFFISACSLVVLRIKNKKIKTPKFLFFMLSCYLGIVLVHAYLWANGLWGAYGLSRLATQGLPLLLVVFLYLADELFSLYSWGIHRLLTLLLLILTLRQIDSLDYPTRAGSFDSQLIECVHYIHQHKKSIGRVYYAHPLVAKELGENPKVASNSSKQMSFGNLNEDLNSFQKGDVILRDGRFGPVDMGLPAQKIQAVGKRLKLIKRYISSDKNTQTVPETPFFTVELYQYTGEY